MVFGLELIATVTDCGGAVEPPIQAKPATLKVNLNGANVQISWTESGTLQVADSLDAPIAWIDVVGAASPHQATVGAGVKFYRVVKK